MSHNDARDKAIHAKSEGKKRGNYSIFRYKAGNESERTRVKHNLSHKEMDEHLRNNSEYRGTKEHGFQGGRTYSKKK